MQRQKLKNDNLGTNQTPMECLKIEFDTLPFILSN